MVLAQKQTHSYMETNRTEISPIKYCHFILDKSAKTIYSEKDSLFDKWCWETGYPHVED
jgi:hypothetical protein